MSATGWTPVDESAAPTGWTPVAESAPAPEQPSIYQRLTASYNPEVEAYAQQHPIFGPVVRFLDAAGGAAMATPGGVAQMLMHPSASASGLMDSIKAWADPNVRRAALSLLPEALGQGVGSVAAGEAAGVARNAIPENIPAKVGTALRTETGALKPAVKTAAQVAGTGVGVASGIPYGGELGGYLLGPKVADLLIPDRPGAASAIERRAVPIANSPNYDPTAYRAGAALRSSAPTAPGVPTATLPGVSVIPEPRPTFEGEQPNYMASVPRSTLPKAAAAGKPGAGTQLQQLGKTVIYAPSGAGIESPDITALQERMSPAAQEAFGPQFTAEQYGDGTTRQVTLHQGGQQQGYVLYDIDPKGVASVNSSLIGDPKLQGKGLGVQMYQKAIEDARAAGASSFQSGDTPEPGAVRVWESLRKSYPVEKVGSGYRIDLAEQPVAK